MEERALLGGSSSQVAQLGAAVVQSSQEALCTIPRESLPIVASVPCFLKDWSARCVIEQGRGGWNEEVAEWNRIAAKIEDC